MARSYAKVLLTIWRDDEFRSLTGDEQRLYLFLISHPDLSTAGTIPLRPSKWAKAAADLTTDGINAAVTTLEQRGYVLVDRDVEELLVRSFIRIDEGYRSPNMLKALRNAIALIESNALRARAEWELGRALGQCDAPAPEPPTEPAKGPSPIPHDDSEQPIGEPFREPFNEGIPNNSPHLNTSTATHLPAKAVLDDEPIPAKTRRSWTDRTDEITRSYRQWYAEHRGVTCPQTHMVLAKIIDRFNEVDRERLTRALAAVPTVSVRSLELELNRASRPEVVTRTEQRQRLVQHVASIGTRPTHPAVAAVFPAALPTGDPS